MSGLIMLALLSGCAEQLLGRNVDCTSYQQIELEGADSLEYNLGRSEHYAFDCFVAVRLAGSEEPGVRYNPDAGVVFLDGYAAPVLSAASAIPAVVGHGLPGGALITDSAATSSASWRRSAGSGTRPMSGWSWRRRASRWTASPSTPRRSPWGAWRVTEAAGTSTTTSSASPM